MLGFNLVCRRANRNNPRCADHFGRRHGIGDCRDAKRLRGQCSVCVSSLLCEARQGFMALDLLLRDDGSAKAPRHQQGYGRSDTQKLKRCTPVKPTFKAVNRPRHLG